MLSRCGKLTVALGGAGVAFGLRIARAEPLRLRADAIGEARAPVGLVVLQASDKKYPYVDAETLVWTGARADPTATLGWAGTEARPAADVLVLTVRLREPHGLGELRGGRFVFSTGAIRPIQIDGISVAGHSPWGTTVEAFTGLPVLPQSVPRTSEWIAGGRVSQSMAARATAGFSYLVRRADGERITEEVGADFGAMPTSFLDVAGKGAYDLLSRGVAEATGSAAIRSWPWRWELFGSHRSPGRLLPATSLFSVLGDYPAESLGMTIRWDAAPRLDILATGAGQLIGGQLGGYGSVRATLRTDDEGDGSLGLEVRRQDVSTARWTGLRLLASEPLAAHWRIATELELARADDPGDRGAVWPWGLMALSWRSGTGWEASTAVEAGATPRYRFETNALLRLARTWEIP
jgi:hypothetical protein